jgi:hypothetical protein
MPHSTPGSRSSPVRKLAAVATKEGGHVMGKYFLAWVLGVPAGILVLIYLIMH